MSSQGGESSHASANQSVSLREFGRRIGVSDTAVRKRIRAGVFSAKALGQNAKGQPVILDVDLARQEWANVSRVRGVVQTEGSQASQGSQTSANFQFPSVSCLSVFTMAGDVVLAYSDPNAAEVDPEASFVFPLTKDGALVLARALIEATQGTR